MRVVIPLCHFQSFFDVLALCSDVLNFSGIWLRISFQHGHWYNLCFSVPFSLLQPRHFFSSDQPMSYNLLCTQPPSTTSFRITVCVHSSVTFLHSTAWIGSRQTPSFNSSQFVLGCPLSPIYRSGLFQKHFIYILRVAVLQTSKYSSIAT